MTKNKLVLVTGGCGFIGTTLVPLLIQDGYHVRIFDNLSVGKLEYLDGWDFEFQHGDIRNLTAVSKAMENIWAVVHLAGQTSVIKSQQQPFEDFDVNVKGTLNMLSAARKHNVQRFVFASSNAPIGENVPPIDETKPARPLSPYGASKLACEGYCSAYHGSYGLGTTVLRFANAYGPGSHNKGSVVAQFIRDAQATQNLTIYGDGAQTRDFIHVKDMGRAIIAALSSSVSGEVFQIATGTETSIKELAEMVAARLTDPITITYQDQRAGEIINNYSDISKATALLNWQPNIALSTGLDETLAWFDNLL